VPHDVHNLFGLSVSGGNNSCSDPYEACLDYDEPLTFARPHARSAGTIDAAQRSLHARTYDVQRSAYQLDGYVILTYT
jgi:hypothetical protein